MNDKRYRAALIGLGRIADTIDDETVGSGWLAPFSHMGSYRDVPEVQVVGASDLYAEQREAFGQRWGIPDDHLYKSYEEMLERERPDIVSVCTHVAPRANVTLDIARMVREGRIDVKCIWVEKPMAVSLEEADAMVEACQEVGIVLIVNAMRASDVYFRRARALIDEGVLGKMLQVTGHGSGALAHMGVHWLGAMCVLAGGSERVSWLVGEAESDEKVAEGGDLAGNAYLAFEDGARGFCRMMPSGASTWTIDAIGELGTIRIYNGNAGYEFELWKLGEFVEGARPTPVRHVFPRPQRIWSAQVGQVKMPSCASRRVRRPTVRATWGGTSSRSRSPFVSRTVWGTSGWICRSPTEPGAREIVGRPAERDQESRSSSAVTPARGDRQA